MRFGISAIVVICLAGVGLTAPAIQNKPTGQDAKAIGVEGAFSRFTNTFTGQLDLPRTSQNPEKSIFKRGQGIFSIYFDAITGALASLSDKNVDIAVDYLLSKIPATTPAQLKQKQFIGKVLDYVGKQLLASFRSLNGGDKAPKDLERSEITDLPDIPDFTDLPDLPQA